jgi:hypothetical protein
MEFREGCDSMDLRCFGGHSGNGHTMEIGKYPFKALFIAPFPYTQHQHAVPATFSAD